MISMFPLAAYVIKVKISFVKSQDNFKLEAMARETKASYMKLISQTHTQRH